MEIILNNLSLGLNSFDNLSFQDFINVKLHDEWCDVVYCHLGNDFVLG